MLPPRPGKHRVRGVVKPQVAFRLPEHLQEVFEAKEKAGYQKTEIVLEMMQVAHDMATSLGDEYYEAERVAKVEGTTTGLILARWAKVGMVSERKGRR